MCHSGGGRVPATAASVNFLCHVPQSGLEQSVRHVEHLPVKSSNPLTADHQVASSLNNDVS